MARAKRTSRADARRRYRVAQNLPDEELDDLEAGDDAASPSDAPRRAASSDASRAARPRPSITVAFRSAFVPLDIAGDLRALPRLLIHIAFLIPAALIVVIASVIVVTGGQELITRELSQFFLAPPPLAPVFIAGFLAPRASWLLGGLLGVVQSVAVLVIISTPALAPLVGVPDTGTFASSMFVSVVFGAFYAAAMAWYKRFLRAANPPRVAPPANRPAGKPRRGSQGRPLLAKRR
ncbi:MAG TPA: hypothetical protein VFO05_00875 [Candidatus Limnocylindrales bacterium]|nr:hypothetical protein [Candidatus Limnocylindrales bacterium]